MFNNQELIKGTAGLRKFALRLTGNVSDADDLVQATVLRALEKKHLYKDDTNLFGWTSKIMFNLFVSSYRRKTKYETQYDPEQHLDTMATSATQEKEMEYKDVQSAMETLSDDHKEILVMVCVQGMQYAEVAHALGLPVGTVRSRLSRARESLQVALDTPAHHNKYVLSDEGYHGIQVAA